MHVDEAVRTAQAAIEQKFLFRKIGLPFDYASDPDDFPSKYFATAKEARANQPNPSGLGSGFHYSCRNHSLLFDGYLLRIELGIEGPGDEAILDRLIGGLIRLATVAPKSFLVGGLAPDGRGFYAQPRRENHIAWAFAIMRGLTTAAIAPESQEKFRSIAQKWMDRIRRERFRLQTVDGKAMPNGELNRLDADMGPFYQAMLLTAARASGDDRDFKAYFEGIEEGEGVRLSLYTPDDGWPLETMDSLLWRQAAWAIIRAWDPDPERQALATTRMRELAVAAIPHMDAWRQSDPGSFGPVDFDWRKFPKATLEESKYGFTPPESWNRFPVEESLAHSLDAAYAALMVQDAGIVESRNQSIEECLRSIDWNNVVLLNALAPLPGLHAYGNELGLWDKDLYDQHRCDDMGEISLAARYLEDDYDDENPDKAGHASSPKSDRPDAQHRRRRRRKKRPAQ